jgi:hypothetical protein
MEDKMKVKEINVKVKRTHAYQSFEVGMVCNLEYGECEVEAIESAKNQCNAHCLKEIAKLKGVQQ